MFLSNKKIWIIAVILFGLFSFLFMITRMDIGIGKMSLSIEDAKKTNSFIESLCVEDDLKRNEVISWRAYEWEYKNIFQQTKINMTNASILIKPTKKEVVVSLYIDGNKKISEYGHINNIIIIDDINFRNEIILKTTNNIYYIKKCKRQTL